MNENKASKDRAGVFIVHTMWDTFISPNNLKMVKGDRFNWEIKEMTSWEQHRRGSVPIRDQVFAIEFVKFDKNAIHYSCVWYPKTSILVIAVHSSDNTISLSTSFDMAETVVEGFIKANNLELMPLYKKQNV